MEIGKKKEWVIEDTIIALDMAQRMLEDAMNLGEEEMLLKDTHLKIEECKSKLKELAE